MKGTYKDDLFRQMFGIINRYYTVHLIWSVLITVMCNICMQVVTASTRDVQSFLRNQGRKNKLK